MSPLENITNEEEFRAANERYNKLFYQDDSNPERREKEDIKVALDAYIERGRLQSLARAHGMSDLPLEDYEY